MSYDIQSTFTTHYAPNIKVAYQQGSKLKFSVRNDGQVIGDKIKFLYMGKNESHDVIRNSTDPAQARLFDNAEAIIRDKQANEIILDVDKLKSVYTPEQVSKRALSQGLALGRASDGVIIQDALENATTTPLDLTSTGLTKASLGYIQNFFDDIGASEDNRFLVLGSVQKQQLLSIPEYTNALNTIYGNQTLVDGNISFRFLGINFIMIETRPQGLGLNVTGNNKKCFAYKSDAIGYGELWSKVAEFSRLPNYGGGADYINSIIQAGATIIDQQGVLPLNVKNDLA
jgi:hypothetical protein